MNENAIVNSLQAPEPVGLISTRGDRNLLFLWASERESGFEALRFFTEEVNALYKNKLI